MQHSIDIFFYFLQNQWNNNKGKCGVCGDPWERPQPRDNEAGGKYGNGIIVKNYPAGSDMNVVVEVTTSHRGWFEFRLCVNNDVTNIINHDCLNDNLLQLADGSGTRYSIGYMPENSKGNVSVALRLPEGLTCSQCVLQWKYNAGT